MASQAIDSILGSTRKTPIDLENGDKHLFRVFPKNGNEVGERPLNPKQTMGEESRLGLFKGFYWPDEQSWN